MSSYYEAGSPNRRGEGSIAGCLAFQSGEEVTTEYIVLRMKQLKDVIVEMKAEMYWLETQLFTGHRIDGSGRNILNRRYAVGDVEWAIYKRRYKEYLDHLISFKHEYWLLSGM